MIVFLQAGWIVLSLLFAYAFFALLLSPSREQLRREYERARGRYEERKGMVGKLGFVVNSAHWWIVVRSLPIVAMLGVSWIFVSMLLVELTR